MAKVWEDFTPDVTADMPEIPFPTVEAAVRDAAIEFFDKTRTWITDLTAIDTVATQQEYPLSSDPVPIAGSVVVAPIEVRFKNKVLRKRTLAWLQERYGDITDRESDPVYFLAFSLRNVVLFPIPSQSEVGVLKVKAAIKPGLNSSGLQTTSGDVVGEEYHESIVRGARGRLMTMNDKSWSNPNLGMATLRQFEADISRTRRRTAQNFVQAPMRGPARFF